MGKILVLCHILCFLLRQRCQPAVLLQRRKSLRRSFAVDQIDHLRRHAALSGAHLLVLTAVILVFFIIFIVLVLRIARILRFAERLAIDLSLAERLEILRRLRTAKLYSSHRLSVFCGIGARSRFFYRIAGAACP